jgi:hypothetical protein
VPDRAWKRAERMLARDIGTERIPVTGERHGADFRAGRVAYQLKVRRALPRWLFTWLDGICATAITRHQIGALVLNLPRRPRREALVIVRWADWCGLVTDAPPETTAASPEEGNSHA